MGIEYRSFTAESVEATDEGHVFGLAIPYNRVTTIGDMDHGGFREQIAPGSCNKSMREADIVALNNHNSWQPLGRTSAGNLALKSTSRGIEPDLQPIDTSYGSDLVKNVKAGIVRGWSFGFEVIKDDWTRDGEPSDEWTGTDRTIREMKLVEVSPVTFPAYDTTEIAARSGILAEREQRQDQLRAKPGNAAKRGSAARAGLPADDERGGNAPGDGSKPYGDVTYADPGYQQDGKKRYPLDTKAHAQAAWAYVNVAANAAAYNSEQLASMKAKIKAALTKFGVAVSEDKEQDLATEWREKIEAKKRVKKAFKESRATLHCVACGSALKCPKCNPVKQPVPKDADPNVHGANHGVADLSDNTAANSAEPDGETRAAKATYSDIDTCGDCGATGQYGKFCTNCGEPMTQPTTSGKYCPSCGSKVDGDRSDHVCETRAKTSDLTSGTAKRIPQIAALLSQALKLFGGADIDSLPDDVQQGIALVSSATTHASHIQNHEGLAPADSISDNDSGSSGSSSGDSSSSSSSSGRSATTPKPDTSTSEGIPDDQALIYARLQMISRDVESGY